MSYVTDIPKYGIASVCPEPEQYYSDAQLMAKFPNGIGSESLLPDPTSGRISPDLIRSYVIQIQGSGIVKKRPTQKVGSGEKTQVETNMEKLVKQDSDLFNQLRLEYCYYEQRYRYALTQFLTRATSRIPADNEPAQKILLITKTLNLRLNSILEIMNFIAQDRVVNVNENKMSINDTNRSINEKLGKLKRSYSYLTNDDAIVKTQKEMVRFTEEKNNYTTNQISIWATLNIIALGSIFYVYRN
jgi:hypothetical protein